MHHVQAVVVAPAQQSCIVIGHMNPVPPYSGVVAIKTIRSSFVSRTEWAKEGHTRRVAGHKRVGSEALGSGTGGGVGPRGVG